MAILTTHIITIIILLLSNLILSNQSQETVHDLLPKYGLPPGLVPDAVESYSISPDTGNFVIHLTSTCYVYFSRTVFYDKTISGTISYGRITNIKGIKAKKLFWVSLTGMVAKPASGEIEFQAGFLSETLSASEFQKVPVCKSSAGCGGGADHGILGKDDGVAVV